jgi:hypothetical protein
MLPVMLPADPGPAMSRDEVQAFFERYRDAFDALDGDAVADLWHSASGIAGSRDGIGHLTWWPDDAAMRNNHRALCAHYRASGYARADFSIAQVVTMGADHAFARLQWTLSRADGSVLQRFGTGYQLLRTAAGPRVVLCTAFEEDLQEMNRHAAQ